MTLDPDTEHTHSQAQNGTLMHIDTTVQTYAGASCTFCLSHDHAVNNILCPYSSNSQVWAIWDQLIDLRRKHYHNLWAYNFSDQLSVLLLCVQFTRLLVRGCATCNHLGAFYWFYMVLKLKTIFSVLSFWHIYRGQEGKKSCALIVMGFCSQFNSLCSEMNYFCS